MEHISFYIYFLTIKITKYFHSGKCSIFFITLKTELRRLIILAANLVNLKSLISLEKLIIHSIEN